MIIIYNLEISLLNLRMANKNESLESISIVCACMNRSKPLKACIGSWLLDNRINEILIIEEKLQDITCKHEILILMVIQDKIDIFKKYH